jgi:hypothetical protein
MKRLAIRISSILLMVVFLSDAYAQDKNSKIDTLSRKIDHLNSKIDSLSRKIDTLSRKVDTLKGKGSAQKEILKFRGMLFSDFVGLNDDQPNGLIQANFYFSYERPYDTKIYPKLVPLWNIVLLDFTFSKIENDKYELPVRYVSNDSTKGYLNRLDLYQYSNMKALSKINLATFIYPKYFKVHFDLIGAFYRTAINDSLKLSNIENLMSVAVGINAKLRTEMDPKTKLSAELSYSYLLPNLFSNTYKEIGGQQYFEHPGQIPQDFVDEELSGINIIDLIIRHKGDNAEKFLRISFCGNYFNKKENTPNIFYQFQLGLSLDLFKLFEGSMGSSDEKNQKKS